jgi:L-asparaginase II
MTNPLIAEAVRGALVESRHRGAYAVVAADGAIVASAGDIDAPVYPRSAVKALQALAVIESGAADRYGFDEEEIALMCASHGGEPRHLAVAWRMLDKCGLGPERYECGAHWPLSEEAAHELARAGGRPGPIHNNCSGKHAGMLALALMLGVDPAGYIAFSHPVQRAVARVLGDVCSCDIAALPHAIDGCSVPTWAIPLRAIALGFARLASGTGLSDKRRTAARRILSAVRANPFLVAGSGRFCTALMERVPRAFVKTGAEGVFCAAVPHAGLGLALKCDDGASRAAEVATAAALARLEVWNEAERRALADLSHRTLQNWNRFDVGEVRAVSLN